MSRKRLAFVQKVVSASAVAVLLLCAPVQLAAQEREGPSTRQVFMLEWFSGLWSDLTSWLISEEISAPKPPAPVGEGGSSDTDSGGCLDPHGGCVGG